MASALIPPVSSDAMEQIALATIANMPAHLRIRLEGIAVRVCEFATAEQLDAVGILDRWMLTGLYEGLPLSQQSLSDQAVLPPVISLFRQPLLREWRESGVGLHALIRHVVIHEAGHHFGFSDEDMHALEDEADAF